MRYKIENRKKRLIVVLGMHRSGTSAIARGLPVLGIQLGDRLIPPMKDNNETGFWEDSDLNAFNIELLKVINNDWDYLASIDHKELTFLKQNGYLDRGVELIRQKINIFSVFGFKDPRTVKLLRFWKEVFSQCQYDVSYVLAVRHPKSVAKSLAKRDGLNVEMSYLMWLQHVINSLALTCDCHRIVVDYDKLMQNTDREMNRIASFLHLAINPPELEFYKSEFLDQKLRHTFYESNDLMQDDAVSAMIKEVYATVMHLSSAKQIDDDLLREKTDKWQDELIRLNSALTLADKLFKQLKITNKIAKEYNLEISELNFQIAKQEKQLQDSETYLAQKDEELNQRNEALIKKNEELNQKSEELNQKSEELNQKSEELNQKSEELNQKSEELNQKSEELNHKKEEINLKDGVIDQKNAELSQKNEELEHKEEEIDQKNTELNLKNLELNQKNEELKHKEEEIDQKNRELNQKNAEIDQKNEILNQKNAELNQIAASRSWRITKPLRFIFRFFRAIPIFWQRDWQLNRMYNNYKRKHPGMGGLARLFRMIILTIINEGIQGINNKITWHYQNRYAEQQKPSLPVLLLTDKPGKFINLPKDVAVHTHIYYMDLATEIRSYLLNIPVAFHLYITTDNAGKVKPIEDIFSDLNNLLSLEIQVTENRGRDIYPMLGKLGNKLVQHEIVLHIHTKRSPHNNWVLGGWRRYLMESLLGNPQRVTAILQQFTKDKKLGILFPDPYHPVKPFVQIKSNTNDHNIEKLFRLAGKELADLSNIDRSFFPAGNMFWFRGKAIEPFINMKLTSQDFEQEEGQVDGTLAHAIERMFPYFAGETGMITRSYFSDSFLSPQWSAQQINQFPNYISEGLISDPILVFDHNLGGGANTFTRNFVEQILGDGRMILRIYNIDRIWFVQWIADGDGMLFYTHSVEELFKNLKISHAANIVVNSLYGCPDIKEVILWIIALVQKLKIPLDVKMHDFYALCVSPHLFDYKGEYCGVPQDFTYCNYCLKKNKSWYVGWYHKKNHAVDIAEWRKPFADLFREATMLTFFHDSSIEVFRRAFSIEAHKIKVVPHDTSYFKHDMPIDLTGPLHIGVLGTLSAVKGLHVVNELYDYIADNNLQTPITVVGAALTGQRKINVHGPYEPNDLPEIISKNGINVILISSIVPETFSYTISEAMIMGLPIVAFDIGAQGHRVRQYESGKVVPLGSSMEEIIKAIISVLELGRGKR